MPGILVRSVSAWALIALVESIHGTLRVLWLQPRVGELRGVRSTAAR